MKNEYGLAFLRVRGIQRVRLQADLVNARTAQPRARASAGRFARVGVARYSPHLMDIGPQNDPMHPAFSPRPPLWLSLAKGAIAVLILLGLLIYVLVG